MPEIDILHERIARRLHRAQRSVQPEGKLGDRFLSDLAYVLSGVNRLVGIIDERGGIIDACARTIADRDGLIDEYSWLVNGYDRAAARYDGLVKEYDRIITRRAGGDKETKMQNKPIWQPKRMRVCVYNFKNGPSIIAVEAFAPRSNRWFCLRTGFPEVDLALDWICTRIPQMRREDIGIEEVNP